MNILAIDGGGVRGVYAAHLLKRIQDETGIQFSEHFDLIAGTSTGAIIAAALATDYSIDEIVRLYEDHASSIFSHRTLGWLGAVRAKYGSSSLKAQLDKAFGDLTLSDVKTNLLIPATDVGNAGVHVFKSSYDSSFVRDQDVRIVDAVLASCSAPTYFQPHTVSEYLLADGGLWANNPSLACLIEAKSRFSVELDNVKMLSIGCGIGHRYYQQKKHDTRGWGFLTGWGGSKLIDLMLNLQSESATNMTGLLLNPEQYLRINYEATGKLSLDDISVIPDLRSRADRDFTHNSSLINDFLQFQ